MCVFQNPSCSKNIHVWNFTENFHLVAKASDARPEYCAKAPAELKMSALEKKKRQEMTGVIIWHQPNICTNLKSIGSIYRTVTYICHKDQPSAIKYPSPMDGMGRGNPSKLPGNEPCMMDEWTTQVLKKIEAQGEFKVDDIWFHPGTPNANH